MAVLYVSGLASLSALEAQESGASDSGSSAETSSRGSGASSSFGAAPPPMFSSPSSGSSFGSFGTTPEAGSSAFSTPSAPAGTGFLGTNPTGTAPPATGTPAASAFGSTATQAPGEPPPSFTLPGAYGQAAQTFTAGQGVLARPRFRYSASLQMGFDDNVLQSPTEGFSLPEQRVQVLVSPAVPEQVTYVPVPPNSRTPIFGGRPPQQQFRRIVTPAQEAKFEEVVVQPAIPAQERLSSFVARASASWQVQFASRRTVFTFDVRGSSDYYFSRPQDKNDLNGSASLAYVYRLTPRLQLSATANLAYLSQPDIRRINTPTRNVGEFFNGTGKIDLSYRWSRRFTTVSSLSLNTLLYTDPLQQAGNFYETTFGTEARYLWSPRLTTLTEVRYSRIQYPDNPLLDSHTAFLLAGAEYIWSPRLSFSVRLGDSVRSFEGGEGTTGGSASTPYLEASVSWRYHPAGALSWNTRYGFEESSSADSQVEALRTGLSLVQAFSARLRTTAALTFVHRSTTNDSANFETTEDTFDIGLGMEYTLTRRWSLNASYNFTSVVSSQEFTDYYRNRLFFGAEYAF